MQISSELTDLYLTSYFDRSRQETDEVVFD